MQSEIARGLRGNISSYAWAPHEASGDYRLKIETTDGNQIVEDQTLQFAVNPAFRIQGFTTDPNSDPLENVQVQVAGRNLAISDNTGYYEISGLSAASYTVSASKSGFTFNDQSVTLTTGSPVASVNFRGQVFVNTPPTAVNDNAAVLEDSVANFVNVLNNDTDPDAGQSLAVISVTQGNKGSVTIGVAGSGVVYTPSSDSFGADSFTYTISDGAGGQDSGTVNMTITAVNDNPNAVDDSVILVEDSGANAINVLSSDTISPDTGETLTITGVGQGNNGSVVITGGGAGLTYAPDMNFFGSDAFAYTLGDGNGGSDTATVNIDITAANDAPDAVDDAFTVAENSSNNTFNVLINDTMLPDVGETLTLASVGTPDNGGAADTDGSIITYSPATGVTGTETFTYTLSDGNGGSDTATVTVTINPVVTPPVAGFTGS